MRRFVITGLIVFSALTLSWVGGASGKRVREVAAAPTRTPTQVEVTNFPAVQGVAGTVNVGNLPAVQNVAGSVAVSNLPLDTAGNVRVSGGGSGGPAANLAEYRFHESDRTLDRFPLIAVPAGYRTVSIFVQTTDATTATVSNWSAGFGSDTAPFVHYNIGDFQVFGNSFPLNAPSGISYLPADFSGLFTITGTHLQLLVNAQGYPSGPPPATTEYYVSLYLMP